jgi:hypothetical protein
MEEWHEVMQVVKRSMAARCDLINEPDSLHEVQRTIGALECESRDMKEQMLQFQVRPQPDCQQAVNSATAVPTPLLLTCARQNPGTSCSGAIMIVTFTHPLGSIVQDGPRLLQAATEEQAYGVAVLEKICKEEDEEIARAEEQMADIKRQIALQPMSKSEIGRLMAELCVPPHPLCSSGEAAYMWLLVAEVHNSSKLCRGKSPHTNSKQHFFFGRG